VTAEAPVVREFDQADASAWVRCRALAFLATEYFDDMVRAKPQYEGPSVELVALVGSELVGVIDVSVDGALATIETVATHPDHARHGVASALLLEAIVRLPQEVTALDAWTREDTAANAWYRSQGFEETFRYLHVYATSTEELASAIPVPGQGLAPASGFFHADLTHENAFRAAYARVHVCRRYLRDLLIDPR
jgi:ribosomal protein S18 acetylase RimI-like enzyme